jgi:hypothetical protein
MVVATGFGIILCGTSITPASTQTGCAAKRLAAYPKDWAGDPGGEAHPFGKR